MNCRNCGSDSVFFRRVIDDKRWGETLTYYKCLQCLVEFHDMLPDPLLFYTSGEYRDRADIRGKKAKRITAQRCKAQVRWLDKVYRDWRADVKTILDIGAYQGIAVGILRDQGFDTNGFEPDPREAEKHEFVTSEISDTGKVDMLWMSHILEHASSAIDEIKRYRHLSNKAFIEIPPGNYQLPHILVFDIDAIKRTLELAGVQATILRGGIRAVVEW